MADKTDRTTVEDQDVAMFMDDTTLSEVIDVSHHLGGIPIGNTQMNVDKVVQFAKDEGMELNYKKCTEMIIDLRKKDFMLVVIMFLERSHINYWEYG